MLPIPPLAVEGLVLVSVDARPFVVELEEEDKEVQERENNFVSLARERFGTGLFGLGLGLLVRIGVGGGVEHPSGSHSGRYRSLYHMGRRRRTEC